MKKKSKIISIVSLSIAWIAFIASYFIYSEFNLVMFIALLAITISTYEIHSSKNK